MASSSKPSMDIFTEAEHFCMEPPTCFSCDEGGELVFCDGFCGKHFHWQGSSNDDGHGPNCEPVTIPVDHNDDEEWKCDRCSEGQVLCFSCGMVGRLKESNPLEQRLVQCAHPECYSFFHLSCIRLHCKLRQLPITRGYGCKGKERDSLYCPRHYCDHCKEFLSEIRDNIQCWKCPKSWCPNASKSCFETGLQDREIWHFDGWKMVYCNDHKVIDGRYVPHDDREH